MTFAVLLAALGGFVVLLLSLRQIITYRKGHFEVVPIAVYGAIAVLADSKVSSAGLVKLFQTLAAVIIIATTITVLVRRRRYEVTHSPASPGMFFMLLTLWVLGVDVAVVTGVSITHVFGRLLAILVLGCFVYLASTGLITIELMSRVIAFVFGLSAAVIAFTPDPTRSCSGFKCGPFGSQLSGPFDNENAFGGLAALALIVALSIKDRVTRYSVIGLALFVLYAADSRDSQIAAACALAAAYIWRTAPDSIRLATRPLLLLLPFALAYEGIHLVYTSGLSDFSDRGIIWYYGRTTLGSHWDLGAGIDSWKIQALSRDYMHSEYMLFLYSGGVVAMIFFVFGFCSLIVRARDASDWPTVAFVVAFLVDGLVQIPWNPLAIEHGSIFGMLLIGLGFKRVVRTRDPAAELEPAAAARLSGGSRTATATKVRSPNGRVRARV